MKNYIFSDTREKAKRIYENMENGLNIQDQKALLGYAFGIALNYYTNSDIRKINHFLTILKNKGAKMKDLYHDWNIDYGNEELVIKDYRGDKIEFVSIEGLVADYLAEKKQPFDEIIIIPDKNEAVVYYNDEEACEPINILPLCEKYVEDNYTWDSRDSI